jgi:GntR family transcriptional regulator
LPDEITVAARLGISRGTVRLAIGQLVHDGLLERRAGVGTRVRPQPAESGIGACRSFSLEMARKGVRVENYRQEFAPAPADEAAARALQIEPQSKIWRLDRVRGWDGRPVLHSRSWFHPRIGLTGREEFSRPLYEVIERETGAVAEKAREEFMAVAADAALAKLLAVKRGEPLLLRSHIVSDAGGRLIEFAQVHYVSSRFALTLEIRRDGE